MRGAVLVGTDDFVSSALDDLLNAVAARPARPLFIGGTTKRQAEEHRAVAVTGEIALRPQVVEGVVYRPLVKIGPVDGALAGRRVEQVNVDFHEPTIQR